MKLKSGLAISDSGFVFDPGSGESFTMNPVAQDIFKLLKEGAESGTIIEKVCARYDVDEATFSQHLDDFTLMLRQYKLIS